MVPTKAYSFGGRKQPGWGEVAGALRGGLGDNGADGESLMVRNSCQSVVTYILHIHTIRSFLYNMYSTPLWRSVASDACHVVMVVSILIQGRMLQYDRLQIVINLLLVSMWT